jgi:outer membrane protein
VAAGLALLAALGSSAIAEPLQSALARTYSSNPTLNAQRAQLRALDETVPQALAGLRPRAALTIENGVTRTRERSLQEQEIVVRDANGDEREIAVRAKQTSRVTTRPRAGELTAEQTLFDGGRTAGAVSQAESQILAARETLRNVEQNVLLDAATAYLDVLRDQSLLELERANVKVLEEIVYQARERRVAGQLTRTDVAQAEARLASGRSQADLAQANLMGSKARYRLITGLNPGRLIFPQPVAAQLLPRTVSDGARVALARHPAIRAALHGADAAALEVKVVQADLYPKAVLTAGLARRYDSELPTDKTFTGAASVQLTVPIYDGGATYSRTRQSKQTAAQRRIEVESVRDEVRAALVVASSLLSTARAQKQASAAQIEANAIALNGVREEAAVGRRTTLDVLNAQQDLRISRASLLTAQRDEVVASYGLLLATGRLSAAVLGLRVERYDAARHFEQVKGLRAETTTPDGR